MAKRRHVHLASSASSYDAVCGSTAAAVGPSGARVYDLPAPFTSPRIYVSCPRCSAIAARAIARGTPWAMDIEIEPGVTALYR